MPTQARSEFNINTNTMEGNLIGDTEFVMRFEEPNHHTHWTGSSRMIEACGMSNMMPFLLESRPHLDVV